MNHPFSSEGIHMPQTINPKQALYEYEKKFSNALVLL